MTTTNCKTVSGAIRSRTIWKRLPHVFMSLLVLFMAAALLTGCKKGSADWKKGVSSLNDGDYKEAVKHFKDSAKKGNADAQMMLAFCYMSGMGVDEPDKDKAEAQLRKAAKTEDPIAMAAYGLYLYGNAQSSYDPDEDEVNDALKYIKKSADQDCVFGQLALAFIYLDEKDEEKRVKGVKYLKKVADLPLKKKKIFLDDVKSGIWEYILEEEPGVKRELGPIAKALTDILEADELTITDIAIIGSQVALCAVYEEGRGVEKDYDKAKKWLNKAKKNGLPKALAEEIQEDLEEHKERERRSSYDYYDD